MYLQLGWESLVVKTKHFPDLFKEKLFLKKGEYILSVKMYKHNVILLELI